MPLNEKIKLEKTEYEDDNERIVSCLLNDPQKKMIKNLISDYVMDVINVSVEDDLNGHKREFTRGAIHTLQYLLILDNNARVEARDRIEEELNNLPYSTDNYQTQSEE